MLSLSNVPRLLIIGYGNPLRGDDGAGMSAAERLRPLFGEDPEVEILAVPQLTPELAEPVSHAALVLFLDARQGGSPGTVWREKLEPDPGAFQPFTHQIAPAGLLAAARSLYGNAPEGWLFSVSGATFAYGERLSPEVQAGVVALVAACQQRKGPESVAGSPQKKGV